MGFFKFKENVKFIKLKRIFKNLHPRNLALLPLGIFDAVERFAIWSEYLYPQYITWDRLTWKPRPTTIKCLILWFFSILTIFMTSHFICLAISELIAYQKDVSSTQVLMLVIYLCFNSLTIVCMVIFMLKVDEICFIFGNMRTLSQNEGTSCICISTFTFSEFVLF